MSDRDLKRRYAQKISNFAAGGSGGGGEHDAPSKLAALDWFAASGYDFMWHLEDDVWSADFGRFASHYVTYTDDLVIRSHTSHPFWVATGWKVGSKAHVLPDGRFCFASLAVFRASRRLATATLHTIRNEPGDTSHHEIYLPCN